MAYNNDVAFRKSEQLLELGMMISKNNGYDLSERKEELKGYILASTSELIERVNAKNITDTLQREGNALKYMMNTDSLHEYITKRIREEVGKTMTSIAYEGVKSGFLLVFRRMGLPESYISSFIKKLEENNKLENQKMSFRAE